MKKKLLILALMLTLLVCAFAISVSAVNIGGINYTLTKGEDGAENTASINAHKNNQSLTVTDIVIPEYVEHEGERYYVTSMSNSAFENTNITSVVFDKNSRIKVIPSWAFKSCANLTYVELSDGIEEIGSNAFQSSSNMKLASIFLPASLCKEIGASAFTGCQSLDPIMVFPAGVTTFVNDTGLQGAIRTLVFRGKMTTVSLRYYGSVNVYFAGNSYTDLAGNYVDSQLVDGVPYYTSVLSEKDNGNNYRVKTGTLTITVFSNNGTNSSGNAKTDANGNTINRVHASQDKFYFCNDNKMCYLIRNYGIASTWDSYFAVFDTVENDTTYKRAPHLEGKKYSEEDSCYLTTFCAGCDKRLSEEISLDAKGHVNGEITSLEYEDGFLNTGVVCYKCSKCNTELTNKKESFPAIFINNGYSTNLDSGSIIQGFAVNRDAFNAYTNLGKELSFGMVAAVYTNKEGYDTTDGKLFDENGDRKHDKVAVVDFTDRGYNVVELVVTGLKDYLDTPIYCCLYYNLNGKVYYINEGVEGETTTAKTINGVIGSTEVTE